MVRTTASAVKQILETDLDDITIDAFITGANIMVTETLGGEGISDALLEEIERWTTAHMIASTRERQAVEEEAGPARQRFPNRFGMGFNQSTYGQMVISLDTTGKMAKAWTKPITLTAIKT